MGCWVSFGNREGRGNPRGTLLWNILGNRPLISNEIRPEEASAEGAVGLCHNAKRKAFRFSDILRPMYPPHVSDQAIHATIRELMEEGRLPSGAKLRAVLKARFGSPGGVSRVYRLLSNTRTRIAPPRIAPPPVEADEGELRAVRERAERAEQREEAHQTRWAMEVDQLRMKVALLEPLAHEARLAQEAALLLRRQLQAAEARVAALEQQLLERVGRGG